MRFFRRLFSALVPAAGVFALLAVPSHGSAQTNGFALQCLGARSAGQGCVNRGQPDAPLNLFRDPAGIAGVDEPTLEVALISFNPSITFQNDASGGRVRGSWHSYPLLSAAWVGPRITPRLSWAVGVEPFGGFGSDFALRHPVLSASTDETFDYESFFAAVKAGPAAAYELTPRLSVGAGVSLVYGQLREFRMPFTIPPSLPRGLPAIAALDPDVYGPLFAQFDELTAYGSSESYGGFSWSADLGIRYETPDGFAVAASWSPESSLTMDGGWADIDLSVQFQNMLQAMIAARAAAYGETQEEAQSAVLTQLQGAGLDLSAGVVGTYDASAELSLPMTVGVGSSIPVGERFRLAGEVEWRGWESAMDRMPFLLTEGDNQNLNLLMNADPTDATFTYLFPLEWEDTWTVKGGIEARVGVDSALRVGYFYGQNPVPSQTVFIAFPAIATDGATVGASFFLGPVPVDVSVTHAFESELQGVPEGHLHGSEYLNSISGLSETVLTVGGSWGL